MPTYAPGPNDLCVLSDVKAYLNIANAITTDDNLLQRLITAASGFMQQWMNRVIAIESYTEQRDGADQYRLMLSNSPIVSVTAVSVDQVAIPSSPNSGTQGYYFDLDSVMLNGYLWNCGLGNCIISYTAGYATVPFELAQACIELVGKRYKEKDRIGIASTVLAGQTVSYSLADMMPSTKTIMNNYRKVIPV